MVKISRQKMILSPICKLKKRTKIDNQKTRALRSKGMRRRYLEPNSQGTLKTTFFSKIRKTAKKVDKIHTREEHAQLTLDLKVLHELARAQELEQQSENDRTFYVQKSKRLTAFSNIEKLAGRSHV